MKTENEKIKRILKNADNPNTCECLYHEGWRAGKADAIKEITKIIKKLMKSENDFERGFKIISNYNSGLEELKQKLGELTK